LIIGQKRIDAAATRMGDRVSPVLAGLPVRSTILKLEIAPRSDKGFDPASKPVSLGQAATLDQQVTQVFKQFRDPVYRYLVAILKNPSTAEEITQETFLRLYGCLREGQDITNVRSTLWARTTWPSKKRRRPWLLWIKPRPLRQTTPKSCCTTARPS
jgi:hypothetical protein